MEIKKISAGFFGCLVKPGIPCKEKGFTNKISNFIGLKGDKKELVSKIVKKNQIENEYKPELFNEIKKIDNYNSYYIIPQEVCKLKEKYKNTIKKVCVPPLEPITEDDELYILLMEAAKKDFSKIELDTDELINNLINISKGFRLLHEKNIIHRDIKIKNIVLAEDKSKIIDWGNATIGEQEVKEGGDMNYLSPEYRRIRIDEEEYLNTLNNDSSRLANNLIINFSGMSPDKQLDYLNNLKNLEEKPSLIDSLPTEKKYLLLGKMPEEQRINIDIVRQEIRFKKSIKNSFLIYTNLLDTEATNFNRNNSFGKEILKDMEKKYISSFDRNDPGLGLLLFSDMSNTELAKKNDVFMLGITFLILLNNYVNRPRRRKANMSDQNFIKKMISLIKKMLNPNLDMYPRNKNKSRITMLDVENELTKLKEMKNSGFDNEMPILTAEFDNDAKVNYSALSKKKLKMIKHKPINQIVMPRPVNMATRSNIPKKLLDDSISQIAGYGKVIYNHGKTKKMENKRKNRLSKGRPYNKPIIYYKKNFNNIPPNQHLIIKENIQEERKEKRIQDRLKEEKRIQDRLRKQERLKEEKRIQERLNEEKRIQERFNEEKRIKFNDDRYIFKKPLLGKLNKSKNINLHGFKKK